MKKILSLFVALAMVSSVAVTSAFAKTATPATVEVSVVSAPATAEQIATYEENLEDTVPVGYTLQAISFYQTGFGDLENSETGTTAAKKKKPTGFLPQQMTFQLRFSAADFAKIYNDVDGWFVDSYYEFGPAYASNLVTLSYSPWTNAVAYPLNAGTSLVLEESEPIAVLLVPVDGSVTGTLTNQTVFTMADYTGGTENELDNDDITKEYSQNQTNLTFESDTVNIGGAATKYTITFKDYDGTTLKSDEVTEGETPVAPADPSRVGYTFTGWDSAIAAATANKVYTATYSQNTYTITFKDYDGTTLKSGEVGYGETPVAPADPSRAGYTFTGWDSAIAAVTGAKVYTATYSQNTYTITFKDYDGTVLKSGEVAEGDMPVAPTDPSRAGYTFTGWDSAIVAATEAKIYTATYEQILYTVTFTNEDNSVIKTDNLVPGASIVKPANPTKANAVFVGWSADGGVSVANVPATADKAYTFKAVFKNIPAPVEKEAGAATFKTYTKGEVVSGVPADADYVAADATLTEVDNTLFRYKVVLTGTNKSTGEEETQEFDDIEFGTGAGDGEVELSGATAKLMVIVKAIKHNITKIAIKALGR